MKVSTDTRFREGEMWLGDKDVRRRRVFLWWPVRTKRKWFWLEWVDLIEDKRFLCGESGTAVCWRLVSVNGVLVD